MERLFDFLRNYAFVRGVTYTSFGIALLMTLLAGHDIKHLGKDYPNDMSDLLLLMNRNNLDVPQSDMLLKSFKIVGVDSIVYDTINTTYSKPILIKTTVEEFCTLNTTSEKTISDVKWESILDEYGQKYRELEIMSKYITRNSLSQSQVNLLVDLLRVRGVDSLSFDKNRQNIETNKSEGGFKTISILAWKDTTFKNEIYSTIWESAKIESRRTPVAHLARLVSGFSACIFLLMFWFLYKKKIISEDEDEQNEPADFSMLFFGLAMLVWAFPTEQVFKIYDFRTFAKPLDDSRAFLNSVFFICGYWDLEYKFPNHWRKHFIAFSFPAWWKSFVEKYLDKNFKRGTFVLFTTVLTIILVLLFFMKLAHTKSSSKDILSWYDFFDFFFSTGFILLFIVAVVSGFYHRIRLVDNPKLISIGSILGAFVGFGFVIVIIFYFADNPFKYRPGFLKPLIDLVETGIFQLIYQFLILFSIIVLAFSRTYSREMKGKNEVMKKRQELVAKNVELGEKQKKLLVINEVLENQKIELQRTNEVLEIEKNKVEAQRKELKHFSRNVLAQFQKEIGLRFSQTADDDAFKQYIIGMVEDIREYWELSIIGTINSQINLPERLKACIEKFNKIFDLQFDLTIDLPDNNKYDAENSLKFIQIINELMFNAKKHGKGISAVSIREIENSIVLKITNKVEFFSADFEKLIKNGFTRNDIKSFNSQGINTLYWLLYDLDQNKIISLDHQTKSIVLTVNKKVFKNESLIFR